MSIEILALLALLVAAVAGYLWFKKRSPAALGDAGAKRERDDLDTVAAWPPEVTRL